MDTTPSKPLSNTTTMDFGIKPATADDMAEIAELTNKARAEMFPHLGPEWRAKRAETDAAIFEKTFFDHPQGAYLIARSAGKLIATIGYQHYDHRFLGLDLRAGDDVVEVVRLYVDPDWRRGGLASKLVAALVHSAREAGMKQLYLHTHPFLPGAIKFWERQGFTLLRVDVDDPVWQTTHMSRSLEE
ncbi:Putative GNAT domain, acyl-CoA N-acyltransferase [Colletotrichum destructivum]|uniref:GNAT domain, acyl-CoA N-acyltransferase n=1 Tax=Colletotrichum destructivum TaxID=34406 RepID=A0AAX4ICI2_9PEZI|nr:Putative GNAT domain, acyl-CoA N-acyltransferase [Colletotrichum destructivum]